VTISHVERRNSEAWPELLPTRAAPALRRRREADGSDPQTYGDRLHDVLVSVLDELDHRHTAGIVALDAGCGHKSPLASMRDRIGRLLGIDVHPPAEVPGYLDGFVVVDLCTSTTAFRSESFDLIFANFVLEHLPCPGVALASLARWLRPGGAIVLTTVNRRHPFVAAYLSLPSGLRDRLQPAVKATPADAHRLVGRCNDPQTIRATLVAAGFEGVEIETIANLGRGWKRQPIARLLGVAGDRLTRDLPTRRSTIIAVARGPGSAV
jgi:SAM-dependent methyltransferase